MTPERVLGIVLTLALIVFVVVLILVISGHTVTVN